MGYKIMFIEKKILNILAIYIRHGNLKNLVLSKVIIIQAIRIRRISVDQTFLQFLLKQVLVRAMIYLYR